MKYNTLTYSLKVWLTSVAAAPFLSITILTIYDKTNFSILPESFLSGLWMYILFTIAGFIFSVATWVVFWLVVKVATNCVPEFSVRQWLIFIAGILLTAATFFVLFSPFRDSLFLILMLCHCTCIGWGTWFYKLKQLTY